MNTIHTDRNMLRFIQFRFPYVKWFEHIASQTVRMFKNEIKFFGNTQNIEICVHRCFHCNPLIDIKTTLKQKMITADKLNNSHVFGLFLWENHICCSLAWLWSVRNVGLSSSFGLIAWKLCLLAYGPTSLTNFNREIKCQVPSLFRLWKQSPLSLLLWWIN